MNKTKLLILVAIVGVIILGAALYFMSSFSKVPTYESSNSANEHFLIGLSLGTLQEERWQKDADLFTKRAEELGAVVEVKYSGENANLQISQAENLIIQGVKVLVVVPYDAATAGVIVDKAHAAGVKVIAYDRMISNSDVDLFITFDSRMLGKLQAETIIAEVPQGKYAYVGGSSTDNNAALLKEGSMKVLAPYISNGSITLVSDTFNLNWSPEEAYKTIKTYLASGKKLDAVIAANDGTAGGVIRALEEYGLAGKVPVSGQDADVAASRRVVAGTQTMTIYKSLSELANKAAEQAVLLAQGKSVSVNGSLNNGKIDVPSYFLDPVVVTKKNIDEAIIKTGFHTREEVYSK